MGKLRGNSVRMFERGGELDIDLNTLCEIRDKLKACADRIDSNQYIEEIAASSIASAIDSCNDRIQFFVDKLDECLKALNDTAGGYEVVEVKAIAALEGRSALDLLNELHPATITSGFSRVKSGEFTIFGVTFGMDCEIDGALNYIGDADGLRDYALKGSNTGGISGAIGGSLVSARTTLRIGTRDENYHIVLGGDIGSARLAAGGDLDADSFSLTGVDASYAGFTFNAGIGVTHNGIKRTGIASASVFSNGVTANGGVDGDKVTGTVSIPGMEYAKGVGAGGSVEYDFTRYNARKKYEEQQKKKKRR